MSQPDVMPHPLPPALAELIAARFQLLGEPMRVRLLDLLRSDALTVGELADRLSTSQQNVSKHLKMLVNAGIVARERRDTSTVCSIIDPLVFEMCAAVCGGIQDQAAEIMQLIQGGGDQ